VVQRLVVTMASIRGSSRRVVEIVGVIDGLAVQTHMLALSAAVEAARAGEHGAGLAVVAGEVRSLAQRSASAAQEIKLLIADSVADIDSGTRSVEEAGPAWRRSSTRCGRWAKSSARSRGQQRAKPGHAGHAAGHRQHGRNHAAEPGAGAAGGSAASTLQRQALYLSEAVAIFKLDENIEPPDATRPPAAPASSACAWPPCGANQALRLRQRSPGCWM
jgi:methyl-accepting chemotaxis protein